ncbi:MAG: DUF3006 domain-containing protein [bacterium]|nr:DUF3006 domain-containing protein [bacterium]
MIIKLTVDRFEGNKAVLITSDGETINWPKNKLPKNLHEGSGLSFDVVEKTEREKRDKQTAKNIINEIINNS